MLRGRKYERDDGGLNLEGVLLPGEKILSECKPFYATSRRIIRYDRGMRRPRVESIDYEEITSLGLVRKLSHPMMILGTLAILAAVFLSAGGFLFFTSILALIVGVGLLMLGARGNLGYYRLNLRKPPGPLPDPSEATWATTMRGFMESVGLMASEDQGKWCLDYYRAGSFIATIRIIVKDLPEE